MELIIKIQYTAFILFYCFICVFLYVDKVTKGRPSYSAMIYVLSPLIITLLSMIFTTLLRVWL